MIGGHDSYSPAQRYRPCTSRLARIVIPAQAAAGRPPGGDFLQGRDHEIFRDLVDEQILKAHPCGFFLPQGWEANHPEKNPRKAPCGLPIITLQRRTIGIVNTNPQAAGFVLPEKWPVRTPKGPPPPYPPHGFDENKGVSRFYFSSPKKTKELQEPIRRRNRHFAPDLVGFSQFQELDSSGT